ncbi:hypothetical protein T484DRAFT_1835468 [Baffinella frigidus]|nr:hypothetical protein T484DRAFT_1835468 [Cryptophyta sp. CCMP2293]
MARDALVSLLLLCILLSISAPSDIPFTCGAYGDDVEEWRTQMVAGQVINLKSADGVTAPMSAASTGNSSAVHFLPEEGADASARNAYRHSALDLSERNHPRGYYEYNYGRSWEERNPRHLELNGFNECMELLKKVDACEALRTPFQSLVDAACCIKERAAREDAAQKKVAREEFARQKAARENAGQMKAARKEDEGRWLRFSVFC